MSRVLIVTGGLLSVRDRSLTHALRKQVAAVQASSAPWLDLHLKAVAAEHLLTQRRFLRSRAFGRASYGNVVARFFSDERLYEAPELSEVLLSTLLQAEGIPWEATTFTEIHRDHHLRERLLGQCDCIFASSTLIRDLSELLPLAAALKRPHNRVVVGGALASLLGADFPGDPAVDLLAVGYGERLVPSIAAWIRSGFRELSPPEGGRLERRGTTPVLYSGVPDDRSLDELPTPDWRLAERYHGRRFPLVHYESMRGCPFRCSFCSYPYLFDDRVQRLKSAERVAQEWARYASHGVEFVSCLDSTFSAPRKRLVALAERLVDLGSPVRWIAYARGDDLDDPDLVRLLRRAGCHQLQIGVESGNATILENMNKRCSVTKSLAALENCRRAGISTLVTLIVGFPGETPATVRESYAFLQEGRPDFAYASPFTTRVERLPILSPESRARFQLRTAGGQRSSSPYWRHATMSCEEMVLWQQWLTRRMMLERVSLEGSLFYKGLLRYRPADRPDLLDFQYDVARSQPLARALMGAVGFWTRRRLERDVARAFAA